MPGAIPPEPEALEIHLDPEDPEASMVTVCPWLHEDEIETALDDEGAEGDPEGGESRTEPRDD